MSSQERQVYFNSVHEMYRVTCCVVFLVVLARPSLSSDETLVPATPKNDNVESQPLLKDWFFHLALEDLIEFKTDAEDLLRVAHLPSTPDYPYPSIGALLDKSHATYPVQNHCAAPKHGGEMRLMLQLVPKDLICGEVESKETLELEPDSRRAETVLEKVKEDELDIGEANGTSANTNDLTTDSLISLVEVEEVNTEDMGMGIEHSSTVAITHDTIDSTDSSAVEVTDGTIDSTDSSAVAVTEDTINSNDSSAVAVTEDTIDSTDSSAVTVTEDIIDSTDSSAVAVTEDIIGSSTVKVNKVIGSSTIAVTEVIGSSTVNVNRSSTVAVSEDIGSSTVEVNQDIGSSTVAVTQDISSSTVAPQTSDVRLTEGFSAISVDGLPHSKLPTESIVSMTIVEVGSNDTNPMIAALFPSSLWMLRVNTSDEGLQYSYVDHINFNEQIQDDNAQAVSMNFIPINLNKNDTKSLDDEKSAIEDGSWENFVMIHKKISHGLSTELYNVTISPVSQSREADLSLIRVGHDGKFSPFYASFQAELPWSPVQASLSFIRGNDSFVVYATQDTITGYKISQSAHFNQLIRADNLATIALTNSLSDMAVAQINSDFYLVVLENNASSSSAKVFSFVEKSQLYDLDSVPVFEIKMPERKFSKMEVFRSNSTNYVIFVGSGSNSALYTIGDSGELIHGQDFAHKFVFHKIIDVDFVENKNLLIFTGKIGALIYSLDSPHVWKLRYKVLFDDALSGSDSTSILMIPDLERGLVLATSSANSSGSLIQMNLNLADNLTKTNDSIKTETNEIKQSIETEEEWATVNFRTESTTEEEWTTVNFTTESTIEEEWAAVFTTESTAVEEWATLNFTTESTNEEERATINFMTESTTEEEWATVNFTTESTTEEEWAPETLHLIQNLGNQTELATKNQDKMADEKVLAELLQILEYYIYLSKDDETKSVNGLKPLIELLKDVRDHEELKHPDYASSIVNVIEDLETSQDNEKLSWKAENVKKLDLVLHIVADIVNEVERPAITEDLVVQLLKEIQSSDQFSNDTEVIEYVIQSLKEHSQQNVSKLERKQTDVILLKIDFIVDGRDVKTLSQNDLKSIIQELKPLTKYDGQELEIIRELVNNLSYLKGHQKDWINEKLKEALITYNSEDNKSDEGAKNMVELLIEELKNREAEDLRTTAEKDAGDSKTPPNSKVSKDADWCSRGNNCHPMADCKSGENNYTCSCKNGFEGNGTHCEDVNSEVATEETLTTTSQNEEDYVEIVATEEILTTTSQNEDDYVELIATEETLTTTSQNEEDYVEIIATEETLTTTSKNEDYVEIVATEETLTTASQNEDDYVEIIATEEKLTTTSQNEDYVEIAATEETLTTTSQNVDDYVAPSQEAQVGEQVENQVDSSNLPELIEKLRKYIQERESQLGLNANAQKFTDKDNILAVTEQGPFENDVSVGDEQQKLGSSDASLEALTIELKQVLADHEDKLIELEKDSASLSQELIDQEKDHAMSLNQAENLREIKELIHELSIIEASKNESKVIFSGKDGTSNDENIVLESEAETEADQIHSKENEIQTLVELIKKFRTYIEEVELEAKSGKSNTTSSGLWPLTEHLREISTLVEVHETVNMTKEVDDLIEQLKHADEKFANASWDVKKLDMILDRERELIENKTSETVFIKNEGETLGSFSKGENGGDLQWLMDGLGSVLSNFRNSELKTTYLELLKSLNSVISKVMVAERTATIDLELLKEILRDLEQAKEILGSASEGPSKEELPAENLPDSRSFAGADSSQRRTIGESSTEDSEKNVEDLKSQVEGSTEDSEDKIESDVEDLESQAEGSTEDSEAKIESDVEDLESQVEGSTEDSEAKIESDVEDLESQVEELETLVEQALDEARSFNGSETDWCSRSEVNCHPDAECRNGASNYTCHCKTGFEGNGTHCQPSANLETATSESKESSNTSQDNNSTEELITTEGIITTEGLNTTEDNNSTEGLNTTEGNTTTVDNNGTEVENTSEGSSTMDDNITSEDNVEDASVNPSKVSSNDSNSKNAEALELEEMIFDWREKFFIIVAFFILFAVLFLIIIAVLIYKMKQSGEYTPIDAPNGSPVSG